MLFAPGAHAACSNPSGTEGKIVYNTAHNVLQYCNGTEWIGFSKNPGRWTAITASQDHACGIRNDGSAWCWGNGGHGRLGHGTEDSRHTPAAVDSSAVSGSAWTAIAAGKNHTCALRDDGTAWCWGRGDNGRLGNGGTDQQNTPVAVDASEVGGSVWTAITAGDNQSCGLRADGTAWCWGRGSNGQRGDGSTASTRSTPVRVGTAGTDTLWDDWTAINAGQIHTCGTRNNGTAWCWGNGAFGQRGDDSTEAVKSTPVRVGTAETGTLWSDWTAITAGVDQDQTCGLRADGTAWCWGRGTDGVLGYGGEEQQHAPVAVDASSVSGAVWTAIDTHYNTACGIRNDGTAWCWGEGNHGRLGYGGTSKQLTPVAVDVSAVSGSAWTRVVKGQRFGCGIRDDGTAWCWGNGAFGKLGYGGTSNQLTPIAVDVAAVSGSTWTTMTASKDHACGIRNDGSAWCWGNGDDGRLGYGGELEQHTPVAVDASAASGSAWAAIAAGKNHTCGLRDDGTAWCWGRGDEGRLGNGGTDQQNTPVTVDASGASGTAWTAIAAGDNQSCGLRDDGTAWCWGRGSNGQRGDGSTASIQSTPVRVGTAGTDTLWDDWTAINAGQDHTCGLRAGGTAWCWGRGHLGQLGFGGTTGKTTPFDVAVIVEASSGCADPPGLKAQIIFNSDLHVLQWCDGFIWRAAGPVPGAGGSACANPSYPAGYIFFNSTFKVLQYCDGTNWRPIGKWTLP